MNSRRHFEFSRVDRYIYIGTSICCEKHFKELMAAGIVADVDLQEEKEDRPFGAVAFLWLPTTDFTAPSQLQLFSGARFIEAVVTSRKKCYIHCNAGEGRAPTLAAAYYITQGLTPEQAIEKIKKGRPVVNPNKLQRQALQRFYRSKKAWRRR